MKSILLRLSSLLVVAFCLHTAQAHEDHHHPKKVAGPNGGRILTTVEPRAEFFVTDERKVRVTFLDEHGKAIAPAGQVVTVIAGDRSAPTRLSFSPAGDSLVSNAALPAGASVPTVVQIKPAADAKPVTIRFNVETTICSECKLAEYACICGH